jgi:hypothetical protein
MRPSSGQNHSRSPPAAGLGGAGSSLSAKARPSASNPLWRGEELDARTGLLSFGAVLHQVATGRAAATGASERGHAAGPHDGLRSHRGHLARWPNDSLHDGMARMWNGSRKSINGPRKGAKTRSRKEDGALILGGLCTFASLRKIVFFTAALPYPPPEACPQRFPKFQSSC